MSSELILDYSDVVSSEPALEPVSVEDVKRNSDVDEDFRDVDFRRWIIAARKKVEDEARIALVTQTRVRKYDSVPCGRVIRLRQPLASVTSVQYTDVDGNTQTYDSGKYTVDTARNAIIRDVTEDWPVVGDPPNVLTVTYVCGQTVASVDERAVQAIHILVKHWFENPSAFVDSMQHAVPEAYRSLVAQLRGNSASLYP